MLTPTQLSLTPGGGGGSRDPGEQAQSSARAVCLVLNHWSITLDSFVLFFGNWIARCLSMNLVDGNASRLDTLARIAAVYRSQLSSINCEMGQKPARVSGLSLATGRRGRALM